MPAKLAVDVKDGLSERVIILAPSRSVIKLRRFASAQRRTRHTLNDLEIGPVRSVLSVKSLPVFYIVRITELPNLRAC